MHLLLQDGRLVKLVLTGEIDQLVVRNTAPKEERQPRSQFQIAYAITLARFQVGGLALLAENEFRIGEDAFESPFDPRIEFAVFVSTLLVETHQHFRVLRGDRPPEGMARQCRYDLPRARPFLIRGRFTYKDLFAALRLACPGGFNRP